MNGEKIRGFIMGGISLSPDEMPEEACRIAATEMKRAGVSPARLDFNICKYSVDARKKKDVRLVYSVAIRIKDGGEIKVSPRTKYTLSPLYDKELSLKRGSEKMTAPPLVVGMGPAGLFCALLLAENGYSPIIIDRGDAVHRRVEAHKRFKEFGVLDEESNIQFGAGGAGTFSDGKLLTRVNDPRVAYVLERFCDFGAPEEIKIKAKPHIGTDLLCGIVDAMLLRIEALGGRVLYRTRLDGIERLSDGNITVHTNKGDIECSSVCLATGHSARDTYEMLMSSGYVIEAKPFSVGVRIEHLQSRIDESMYGDFAGHPRIGKGEYHLSDTTTGRGVYTFCMCPGGEVVAAASECGGVVVNGMSSFARDGKNANSAVCVSVRPEDYGATPAGAIAFQRKLERAAFDIGGGNYNAPLQTVGDFLSKKTGSEPTEVEPTYRSGRVRLASMDDILPEFVTRELRHGILSFDKKLAGFSSPTALLSGAETRTSSPVRIMRNEELCAVGHDRIYPCGEGAGYAGGITSAAMDGIRVAEKIMERYAPEIG